MRQYTNPTRLDGPYAWFQVVSFSGTPTFSIEDGGAIQIFGFYTIPAARRRPFKGLTFTGTVTVIVGDPWDEIPPDKGIGSAVLSGSVSLTAPSIASYKANFQQTMAGAGQLIAIEAGAAKITKIRRVRLTFTEISAAAAAVSQLILGRTTAASTGGALVTPTKQDPGDGAFSGLVRTAPALATTPAFFVTGGPSNLVEGLYNIPAAANVQHGMTVYDYVSDLLTKPLAVIPAGVANGVALMQAGAVTTGTVLIEIWFTEE
jgi:hypothetical protein